MNDNTAVMVAIGDEEQAVATEVLFDRFAGVNYCLFWLQSFFSASGTVEAPLFSWLLSCRALVAGSDSKAVIATLERQIDLALAPVGKLGRSLHAQAREQLRQKTAQSWAAWLPFLVFAPDAKREALWAKIYTYFPPSSSEEAALREVLFWLLREEEAQMLYTSDGLSVSYDSQAECAVVRVGRLLKRLSEESNQIGLRPLYQEWRERLRLVFDAVRSTKRVERGFAVQHPLFEDLILALLSVAEWRAQSELWRIPIFVNRYQERDTERLSSNQIVLAAIVFGLHEGYIRLGGVVQNRTWRRYLSRLGLALALRQNSVSSADEQAFYCSPAEDGDDRTVLHLRHAKLTETITPEFSPDEQLWHECHQGSLILQLSFADLPELYQCEFTYSSDDTSQWSAVL